MRFLFSPLRLFLVTLLLASCNQFSTEEDYRVGRYGGVPITSEASIGWAVDSQSQTLTLRFTQHGEADPSSGNQGFLLTLSEVEAALPRIESAWHGRFGSSGHRVPFARLLVQTWEPERMISGALEARPATGGVLYIPFWIDLAPLP